MSETPDTARPTLPGLGRQGQKRLLCFPRSPSRLSALHLASAGVYRPFQGKHKRASSAAEVGAAPEAAQGGQTASFSEDTQLRRTACPRTIFNKLIIIGASWLLS